MLITSLSFLIFMDNFLDMFQADLASYCNSDFGILGEFLNTHFLKCSDFIRSLNVFKQRKIHIQVMYGKLAYILLIFHVFH